MESWPRRAARKADAGALLALSEAIGASSGTETILTAADVDAALDHPGTHTTRDTLAIVDLAGSIRAYAIAHDEAPGRTEGELLIDPALGDADQDLLLDELVAWVIHQTLTQAERYERASTVAVLAAAQAEHRMFDAYARHGFSHVRTFWRMGLWLNDGYPEQPWGVGFTVLHVDPATDDVVHRLHALDHESFIDHYGFVPIPHDQFAAQTRALAGFDPRAVWIAQDDDGSDVGFLVGTDRRSGDLQGYIAMLGVRPGYRGRGVAKALLRHAFDYYKERGMLGVQLGVDAHNTTGATRLYESMGMSQWETFEVWELPLTREETAD